MKKVKILGKVIPVFVLVLLGIGMVSAALVTYLSNQVEAKVTVESPIVQEIKKEGGNYGSDPISFTSFGGESVKFFIKDTNLANVPTTGNVNNIITNPSGVTCADFVSVNVKTTGDGGTTWSPATGYHDLISLSLCTNTDSKTVTFSYGPVPMTLEVGQTDVSEIVATFKPAALGVYTFTSQVVPV